MKAASFRAYGKAVLAFAISFMLLAGTVPGVGAETPSAVITASIDSESRVVSVRVTVSPVPQAEQPITLFVLNPHDPAYTLADVTDDTISDVVCISKQGMLDVNGACSFQARLGTSAPGGWYQVKVGGLGMDLTEEQRSATFYYANPDEIAAAKDSINMANSEDIAGILEEYAVEKPILGLDLSGDYAALPQDEIHTEFLLLRDEMPSKAFTSVAEIQEAFQKAVGFVMMNHTAAEQMDAVIRNYGVQLGLEDNEDYANSADIRSQTHTVLSSMRAELPGKQFASIGELQAAYRSAVAVGTLNCSGRAQITDVLERYNDVFELDLDGDYSRLGDDQVEVNKALFQKGFTDIASIQAAFDQQVDEVLDAKENDSRPSTSGGNRGGSSSGGGGRGGSVSIDMTVTNDTPDTQLPEEPDTAPDNIEPSDIFTDIDHVGWAKESIEALAERQIVAGTGGGLFEPDAKVTREQFLKMLVNCMGILETNRQTDFTDVVAGQWYYPYIASAQKAGIVSGMGDGTFGLGREITRQEIAVMIDRAAKYLNLALPSGQVAAFTDESSIDGYAVESVKRMQQAGIIAGVGNGQFLPKQSATRAESAKMIYTLLQLIEK